ncbi:hypothetical protein K1719_045546 [Acacia pycnantha]|nr:hypothetical protein K1719_045546 [Acacia pycnantha]
MKLTWSPDSASKAYLDTVKTCQVSRESGVAELVAAMAAGWNAQFIAETWMLGGAIATSIGLAIARSHTGGRHVCGSRRTVGIGTEGFLESIQIGEIEQQRRVLVSKNANSKSASRFRWRSAVDEESSRRVVRSVFLPVGKGLDIAHVSAAGGGNYGMKRWIKHFDQRTGELHVIRK